MAEPVTVGSVHHHAMEASRLLHTGRIEEDSKAEWRHRAAMAHALTALALMFNQSCDMTGTIEVHTADAQH